MDATANARASRGALQPTEANGQANNSDPENAGAAPEEELPEGEDYDIIDIPETPAPPPAAAAKPTAAAAAPPSGDVRAPAQAKAPGTAAKAVAVKAPAVAGSSAPAAAKAVSGSGGPAAALGVGRGSGVQKVRPCEPILQYLPFIWADFGLCLKAAPSIAVFDREFECGEQL